MAASSQVCVSDKTASFEGSQTQETSDPGCQEHGQETSDKLKAIVADRGFGAVARALGLYGPGEPSWPLGLIPGLHGAYETVFYTRARLN